MDTRDTLVIVCLKSKRSTSDQKSHHNAINPPRLASPQPAKSLIPSRTIFNRKIII